jgi:acyl-CoA thioesterase-1
MRHVRALRLIWLLVAAALVVAGCGKHREEALPSGSVVLALGDSLTEGAGVSPEQAWPNLLAAKTGWTVVNGGKSGDTSAMALARLPQLLDEHHPALVLVTLGGNDMLRRLPQEETVANLESIISLIKAHNAKVVLLATPNPSLMGAVFHNLSAPDFYRAIAQQQNVALIEDAIPEVLSDPELKVDPLHPNAAGHALLAEKIHHALKNLGYAR